MDSVTSQERDFGGFLLLMLAMPRHVLRCGEGLLHQEMETFLCAPRADWLVAQSLKNKEQPH